MTIIGLMGKARAGKDTVGGIIKSAVAGAETIALADPIKVICGKLFDFSHAQLYGELKEVPDKRYPRQCGECSGQGGFNDRYGCPLICGPCDGTGIILLTPRWAMQYVGTEIARALYTDVWIDYGMRRANELITGASVKTGYDEFITGVGALDERPIVAFTDVRFINEACKIVEGGGVIWRIIRPDIEKQLSATSQAHVSEMEQESNEIDQYVGNTIINDRGLAELEAAVKDSLNQIGVRPTTQDLAVQAEGAPVSFAWKR